MKHLLCGAFLFLRIIAFGQSKAGTVAASYHAPTWSTPPKLVVGIVVDQMRVDYIYRFWDNLGDGGFKRMVREGAFMRNTHYDYAPTHTAPGHASVYTGTTPMHHGIVANDMYVRATGGGLYCVQDDAVSGVGGTGHKGQRSPLNLLSGTITDELERRTEGRSKTIGVAMKDRGAILPIGRTGDAAYWFFEGTDGQFATSTWYMKELPDWVKTFNARGLARKYLSEPWDLLLPRDRYHTPLPDDNPYEEPLAGSAKATLPMDVKAMYEASGRSTVLLRFIPASNTYTTDMALAALEGEAMGRDQVTDLLAISYSAPDELGHEMGPRSLELEDMYLRLDRELERLMNALDANVGKGQYTLFLTADHAVVDVPAYLRDQKASAGYVEVKTLVDQVEAGLSRRFGAGHWVRKRLKEQLFLNDSLIAARGLDPVVVQRAAADELLKHPQVADAITAADLARDTHASGLRRSIQRGFMPMRSGDVCYVMRPSHLAAYANANQRGTDHGSPWNYDTNVPLLMVGAGVKHVEVVRRVSITDVAPTIAMIVGCALPDAAIGDPIPEVLR
ncbi:MAG: alkaline phosphatase family protein [Flavobacteriales bacterium]|jgi:arylsulfatase A-like enzyme|nr:MAG: alkaline phosphatase family protein [Flavobacteriales bacterium]